MSLAYAFGDETWPGGTGNPRLRVAIVLVEQEAFNRLYRGLDLRNLPASTREEALFESLVAAGVSICEGRLHVPPEELPVREEVSGVAAPNLLLTSAIGWTLGRMLLRCAVEKTGPRTVDLLLDPLSLGPGLDDRFRSILEQQLQAMGREFLKEEGLGLQARFPRLRRVSWVEKAQAGRAPSKFQFGTHLAHRFLAMDPDLAASFLGTNLSIHDLSETFLESFTNFKAGKEQGALVSLDKGGKR